MVKTPEVKPQDILSTSTTIVNIDPAGNTGFSCKGTLKGELFEYMNGFSEYVPDNEKSAYYDRIGLMSGADIDSFEIKKSHRDSCFLTIQFSGKLNHPMDQLGAKTLLYPAKSIKTKLELPEKRKTPVFIPYPSNIADTIIYRFNKNISDTRGISNANISCQYGQYIKRFTIKDNTLTVYRFLSLNSGRYDLNEYEAFYRFFDEIAGIDNQKTIINFLTD